MVDQAALQNLNLHDQIVTDQGTSTPFFMRLLQRKTLLAGDTAATAEHLAAFTITTTAPVHGGPVTLGVDDALALSHDDSGVVAGTYGDATHVAQITVDATGHVTDVVEVAITAAPGTSPTLNEVPSGTINGSNVTFTLAAPPSAAGISLFQNGLLLKPTTDYSLSTATITMVAAPLTGDTLLANYFT